MVNDSKLPALTLTLRMAIESVPNAGEYIECKVTNAFLFILFSVTWSLHFRGDPRYVPSLNTDTCVVATVTAAAFHSSR